MIIMDMIHEYHDVVHDVYHYYILHIYYYHVPCRTWRLRHHIIITSSLPEKGRGIHEIIRSKFKVGLKSSLKCSKWNLPSIWYITTIYKFIFFLFPDLLYAKTMYYYLKYCGSLLLPSALHLLHRDLVLLVLRRSQGMGWLLMDGNNLL